MRDVEGDAGVAKVRPYLDAALLGSPQDFSVELPYRLGGAKVIHAKYIPDFDANTCVKGIIVIVEDVSIASSEAAKLRSSEELLSTVLDTLPVAVFGKDIKNDFNYTIWNKHAEELFGLGANQLLGKCDRDIFPKDQANFFREKDVEASKTLGVIAIPEEPANTARGPVTLRTRKTVVRDSMNRPSVLLGITEDISDALKLQKSLELERVKVAHNAKFASLGEMAAGIAHEINNPLAIVSGAVGLLLKFKDNPEKFASKIELMKKSCDRIAQIVGGLKKFSRSSDAGGDYLPKSLAGIVREAGILTEAKSNMHKTPVNFEFKTEALIQCNEVEIEQVLVNLIHNGIDAVRGLPEKWIKVSTFEEGSSVVLRVMDSGTGISKEIREKLFQPFFTTKKVGEGTGLGLSITKGILDEHKASIMILDDVPHTCFEIRFVKVEALKNAA